MQGPTGGPARRHRRDPRPVHRCGSRRFSRHSRGLAAGRGRDPEDRETARPRPKRRPAGRRGRRGDGETRRGRYGGDTRQRGDGGGRGRKRRSGDDAAGAETAGTTRPRWVGGRGGRSAEGDPSRRRVSADAKRRGDGATEGAVTACRPTRASHRATRTRSAREASRSRRGHGGPTRAHPPEGPIEGRGSRGALSVDISKRWRSSSRPRHHDRHLPTTGGETATRCRRWPWNWSRGADRRLFSRR